MCFLRMVIKLQTNGVRNEEVIRGAGIEKNLIIDIRRIQLNCVGHV